jgi:hypothetical protein
LIAADSLDEGMARAQALLARFDCFVLVDNVPDCKLFRCGSGAAPTLADAAAPADDERLRAWLVGYAIELVCAEDARMSLRRAAAGADVPVVDAPDATSAGSLVALTGVVL